jgi:hypothetical protein
MAGLLIGGQVGPQVVSDGSTVPPRLEKAGGVVVQELHGRYYETAYRKALFSAANSAGVTTTVGTATTYVGFCLSNPIGSPVNLAVNKAGYAFTVAFAAASAVGLMVGYSGGTNVTHTTPLTPRSNFVGLSQGYGLVDSSATLSATPTIQMIMGAGLTGAITTLPSTHENIADLEGSLILPPGAFVAFYTSTASGTSGAWFSMQWEEIPI